MIALRILSAVRGLFTADSLALGAHWVYDQNVLREQVGDRLHDGLLAPIAKWHEGKTAGDFTMYGDQCLWLLEHLAKQDGAYDEGNWAAYWREHMAVYTGYVDSASKTTLGGTPSDSHDFSAVGRVTPLLAVAKTEDELVTVAKSAVRITHNNPKVIAAAELVGRVAFRLAAVPEGQAAPSVVALLTEVADKLNDAFVSAAVAQGLAAAKDGNITENAAISGMGAGCSIEGGLPSTVFLLARHEAAGKGAAGVQAIMVANCLAGGDSAARGMVMGTLLGLAYPTESATSPQKWYGAVKTRERIEAALGALGK